MKYIILVPDGLADRPIKELGGKTPLEAAKTPFMDAMAADGFSGLVKTIPDGLPPGSDIGNLALMGYNPKKNFSGRASLEAANMGIQLKSDEVVFRCNLITAKNDILTDYSAGHITTQEAKIIINDLQKKFGGKSIRFYPGKSYRHLLVVKTNKVKNLLTLKTTPPHDIINKKFTSYLPSGKNALELLAIMEDAHAFLKDHPLNAKRIKSKLAPANRIWLWGQGSKPNLPTLKEKYGLTGSVISAVDLVNGIGRLAGLKVIQVPGANGYYDTNYAGKAAYALRSLKKFDFVYVHVEATDEAGHNGDWKAKRDCCAKFDQYIVGAFRKVFNDKKGVRILIAPDHPTPIALRTHDRSPVPFVIWGDGIKSNGLKSYSETEASKAGLKFKSGEAMVKFFLRRGR